MALLSNEEALTAYARSAGLSPLGSVSERPRPQAAASGATSSARPQPLGTQIGGAARGALQSAVNGARAVGRAALATEQGVVNSATYPLRNAGGIARDAGNALLGRPPSPNAGQPLPGLDFSRPLIPSPMRADFSDVRASASTAARPQPRLAAPAPAAAPAAAGSPPPGAMTTLDGRPGGLASGVDPATGARIYDNSSIARLTARQPSLAVPANVATPAAAGTAQPVAAVGAAGALAPRPQPVVIEPPQTTAGAVAPRGRQGGIIENPNDSTLDKLERALTSAAGRGSPQNRRLMAEAILGEAAGRREERAATLRAQDGVDQTYAQAVPQAVENDAQRRMQAAQFNGNAVLEQQNAASRERIAMRPQATISATGGLGLVSDDGRYTPVRDPSGRPVAVPRPATPGALGADDLLKAYSDQRTAIQQSLSTPEEKRAQMATLDADPLFASLRGGAEGPTAENIALLRSDPKLAAQFDEQFGQGAAQRYLGN